MNVLSFDTESNVNHTNYYSTFAVEISNQEENMNSLNKSSPPQIHFDKNIKIKRGRKSRDVKWQDVTGRHHIMVLGPDRKSVV